MASREDFLRRIRGRLQDRVPREEYSPTHAPDVPWTRSAASGEKPGIGEANDLFLKELHALGGHGERVPDLEAARDYVLGLAKSLGAGLLARWDDARLDALGADEPLRKAGTEVEVCTGGVDPAQTAARADIGLTTAELAVAETGSIAVSGGPGKGRSVTLLPPTHVAVVPADRLVPTVGDAIARYARPGSLPASLCLHTGPSRSGDIEQVLTVGVHGPGDVHVLLVG